MGLVSVHSAMPFILFFFEHVQYHFIGFLRLPLICYKDLPFSSLNKPFIHLIAVIDHQQSGQLYLID
jgi:hypothetical protein